MKNTPKSSYTQAKREANARYDDKTYKMIGIKLRLKEDADIIIDFEKSKDAGLTSRQWLRKLLEETDTGTTMETETEDNPD